GDGNQDSECGRPATDPRWSCSRQRSPHIPGIMGGQDSILDGVIATGGQRLDRALADATGLSRERIKALLGEGRVLLGGKAVSQASLKPDAGTAFAIAVPEAAPAEAA